MENNSVHVRLNTIHRLFYSGSRAIVEVHWRERGLRSKDLREGEGCQTVPSILRRVRQSGSEVNFFRCCKNAKPIVILVMNFSVFLSSSRRAENFRSATYNFLKWKSSFNGREPWSSGKRKRLIIWRLCVRIQEPDSGWTFFHINLLSNLFCSLEKTEIKWKRGRGWPIF